MNIEELREYCIGKPFTEEAFPFDNETLVFKVMGKIFLLTGISAQPLRFNAKCDPEKAIELREQHSSIIPGYHMNKKHWNTIICDGSLSKKITKNLIDHSYDLIVSSLPKKLRDEMKK